MNKDEIIKKIMRQKKIRTPQILVHQSKLIRKKAETHVVRFNKRITIKEQQREATT